MLQATMKLQATDDWFVGRTSPTNLKTHKGRGREMDARNRSRDVDVSRNRSDRFCEDEATRRLNELKDTMDSMGVALAYPTATTIKFIETLKRHPIVYDMRLRYVEAKCKQDAWKDVATAMQMSVEECMRRWRYLRDRYCRERKAVHLSDIDEHRNPASSASSKPATHVWPHYHHMSFLDPHIKHRLFAKRGCVRTSDLQSTPIMMMGSDSNDLQDSQDYNGTDDDDDDVEIYEDVPNVDIKRELSRSSSPCADHVLHLDFNGGSEAEHNRDDLIDGHCPHDEPKGESSNYGVIVENVPTPAEDDVHVPRRHSSSPDGLSKRFRQELQYELMEAIRSTQVTVNDIIRSQQRQQQPAEDEDDLFGRTVAASLKTFTSTKRWQAKAGIIQLLQQLQTDA